MGSIHLKGLLTEKGWLENALVTTDTNGIINSIGKSHDQDAEVVNGYALPGFQNAHSHAFQYAMAGMGELHPTSGNRDDFWSWRKTMYDLALAISPEQLENIASMLYSEMVRHGYTSVAEFHYLHHTPDGQNYANLAEMGERLIAAAMRAGIKITLTPIYYQRGGFGKGAETKQRRFISPNADAYYKLLEASKQAVDSYENAHLGMGIHSLRAVDLDDIQSVCKAYSGDVPFHIHISEQLREIEDCKAFTGQRPVEWLLNHTPVSPDYHLVHATHLDNVEVAEIAESGAHVVICPSTEGNLGDGRFRLKEFQKAGGKWSIGTDSHVGLNPLEELRMLDYGQRIFTHHRDSYCTNESRDSGLNAIKMAWRSGQKAMGTNHSNFFEIGQPFDAVIYNANSPLLSCVEKDHLTNTIVYSADQSYTRGTIINGKWASKEGKHLNADEIVKSFKATITTLRKS